ncbi:MAG TPA: alpha/beta hydrolase [Sphingobium sp.]|nr:alpha/beta hydrolase [Sphingobium sp.]
MKYLNYDERPDFPPPAMEYHERASALAAQVTGTDYAFGSHPLQTLTVFPAAEPTGEILLVIHGGRWRHGYREHMSLFAPPLNRRGITVVSSSYRLAPGDPFPAGFQDSALALRWIGDNIAALGGRSDAIFVGGHSAGGHYAALLAIDPTSAAVSDLPPIAGCLPVSGVFKVGLDTVPGPILFPDGATDEEYRVSSPLDLDVAGKPPFLIVWGEDDDPIVKADSIALADKIKAVRGEVETLIIEGKDHFGAGLEAAEPDSVLIAHMEGFMRKHRAPMAV